jgi:hypothetical protein
LSHFINAHFLSPPSMFSFWGHPVDVTVDLVHKTMSSFWATLSTLNLVHKTMLSFWATLSMFSFFVSQNCVQFRVTLSAYVNVWERHQKGGDMLTWKNAHLNTCKIILWISRIMNKTIFRCSNIIKTAYWYFIGS